MYDCFVDEVVRKDVLLGESAIGFLEEQASKMMSERRDSFLYNEIRIPAEMLQRLVSQGILFERTGRYSFAHQTLMENFIVHDVLKKNLSLCDFILSHPPLPFIRPTVRVLFFHLENQDQRKFVRQVREVISNDDVAMHLKRLVAESLGEVQPVSALWPLVRFLFNQDATLFKRFLWRTSHPDWFMFFEENLFPLIQSQTGDSWHKEYILKIQKWMNAFPDAVVQHWLRIVRDPALADSFRWDITRALIEFAYWKTDGLYEVFSYLVNAEQDEYPLIGGPLSKFIAATGEGDDLLWILITRKSDTDEYDLKKKLLCSKNVFVKDDFLVKRFGKSNLLLENALGLFSEICSEYQFRYKERRFLTDFTSDSSFRFKLGDERRYSSDFNVFLDCIEYGLISNCRANSNWWRERSHSLYLSTELSIVYFLIKACCENPESNIDLIGDIVTDVRVLKERFSIVSSLGKLMNTAYPLLSAEVQDFNQNCILSLYDDEEKTDDYKNGYKLDLLQWIPAMYRTVEAQKFMDNMLEKNWLPERKTYSLSGMGLVKSPWPLEQINKLSKEGFLTLLKHFDNHSDNWEEDLDGDLRGGREQLERAVYRGAVNDPTKYMSFVDDIINANVGERYHCEILSGVVDHLDHRFGNLNLSNSWSPVELLPDGKEVAQLLLDTVHEGGKIWDDPSCVADVVRVVSNVFEDESPLSELTDILIKLDELNEDNNIDESSRKRRQGHLLQSIIAVLTQSYKEHESGSEVLKNIACHRSIRLDSYSKSYVLSRLPFIIYHDSNLGWKIFDNIFLEIDDDGISFVEAVLYNNYSRTYPKVKEYLDCFVDNHIEEAYESWGRISSLAYLSGHVSWDSLCLHIEQLGKDCATGCAQVFATNIDKKECMEMCEEGLLYLLLKDSVSDDVVNRAAKIFEKKIPVSDELIYAFLDAVSKTKSRIGVRRFNDWLAQRAAMNPCWAIAPCERLADVCIPKTDSYFYMSGRESLICTLTEILREADESDDEELIMRVLNVQDKFLDLGITDIEQIYTDYN